MGQGKWGGSVKIFFATCTGILLGFVLLVGSQFFIDPDALRLRLEMRLAKSIQLDDENAYSEEQLTLNARSRAWRRMNIEATKDLIITLDPNDQGVDPYLVIYKKHEDLGKFKLFERNNNYQGAGSRVKASFEQGDYVFMIANRADDAIAIINRSFDFKIRDAEYTEQFPSHDLLFDLQNVDGASDPIEIASVTNDEYWSDLRDIRLIANPVNSSADYGDAITVCLDVTATPTERTNDHLYIAWWFEIDDPYPFDGTIAESNDPLIATLVVRLQLNESGTYEKTLRLSVGNSRLLDREDQEIQPINYSMQALMRLPDPKYGCETEE